MAPCPVDNETVIDGRLLSSRLYGCSRRGTEPHSPQTLWRLGSHIAEIQLEDHKRLQQRVYVNASR